MLFRVLVSVACVAVVAFVGTFFWDRYQVAKAAEEREAFLSLCDLNYRVEENVLHGGREMPRHVRENVALCKAAGIEKSQ